MSDSGPNGNEHQLIQLSGILEVKKQHSRLAALPQYIGS